MNLGEDNSGFIQKLFLRHVWPSVAAQVISTVGPIVSSAIAGIVFGQTGLAMNGLFSPFFFLAGFFGTVVASGSTAVAARYIAKDDDRRIAGIYTLALVLASGLALLLCLAMTLLREPVVAVLAGGELLEPARRYYAPTVWYMFFTVVVYVPLFWARLAGRPSVALALTLTMAGANIGLAVLFTAVVGLGLEYLAVSQALSTALALSVALIMLHRRKNGLRLAKPIHIAQDITALALAGSPLGLSRLYRFASVFLLNILLLSAVGPGAVAVYSVLNSLLRFVTAFANGVSGVQMPIAGVLLEERDTVSLKLLARVMLRYGNAVIFAVAALMAVFRGPVAAAFGMGGDMFFTALLCFCAYLPFYLNGSLFVSWYTAIRQVGLANIVTLAQDMALPLIFAAALSGGGWLWLHLPLAGVALALLLPPLLLHMSKTGLSVPLLLDTRARGPALAFSVERESAKASDASAAVDDFCREIGLQKRQAMLMSLAVEEMVTLIGNHDAAGGNISIRLTQFNGSTVLRLRDNGRKFNPIDYYNSRLNESEDFEDSVDLLGVKYIVGAAKVVYYRETFGVNNLVIII
jgi:Na+-driven multidrug efflux pump/anti-sigma regulatory factor (Ser/Thr protein kinase)